jgi:hypothetical protein
MQLQAFARRSHWLLLLLRNLDAARGKGDMGVPSVLYRGQKHDAQMALCESLRMMPCNWAAWQVSVKANKIAVLSSPACLCMCLTLVPVSCHYTPALLCRRCST